MTKKNLNKLSLIFIIIFLVLGFVICPMLATYPLSNIDIKFIETPEYIPSAKELIEMRNAKNENIDWESDPEMRSKVFNEKMIQINNKWYKPVCKFESNPLNNILMICCYSFISLGFIILIIRTFFF